MKVLVFGANGFVGKSIVSELVGGHEVWKGIHSTPQDDSSVSVNLLDVESVINAVKLINPRVIINAAGIVENTEKSAENLDFTKNILTAMAFLKESGSVSKLIVCGSAAEYGYVLPVNLPVNEECPAVPSSVYGTNKHLETEYALEFTRKAGIELVVARIFNPIGIGMQSKFLVPKLIREVEGLKGKSEGTIEINRLDSKRDYINIKDVARAIKAIIEHDTLASVYNVGSGESTSNGELLELILANSNLSFKPKIVELVNDPEPLVAIQADISRIKNELGWKPLYTIEETVKEIIHATGQ